jgi:hypothetical protein
MFKCEYCNKEFEKSITSGHKRKCPEFLKAKPDRNLLPCLCGHESTSLTQMKRHRKLCLIWNSRDKNSVALERIKSTFQKKYGVTNAVNILGSKEKAQKTNLERYGASSPFSKKSSLYEKVQSYWDGKDRTSHLDKNNFAKPEIKEKIRQTNLQKYGFENPMQNSEIKKKVLATNLLKYGDEQTLRVAFIREKGKQTLLSKHGFDDAAKIPEIKEKIRQTNMERYDVPWTTLGNSREKQYETQIKNYGNKFFASEEGKRIASESFPENLMKIRQTNMERYGVPHPMQNKEYAREHLEKMHSKNGINGLEKRFQELYPFFYFAGDGKFWRYLPRLGQSKCPDFMWKVDQLDSGVSFGNVTHIIELFGDYWHSEKITGKSKEEHVKEIIEAWEEIGFKCLVLWEHEVHKGRQILDEKISNFLEIDLSEFGIELSCFDFDFKNVNIKPVENQNIEVNNFLNLHHYAKFGRSSSQIYSTCFNNELVAIVKFASAIRQGVGPSVGYNNSEILELDRFCIHPEYQKKNFASWIMSRIIKLIKQDFPQLKALVSFADSRFDHHGGIYIASNWTQIGKTSKSYVYIDPDGNEINKKTLFNFAKVRNMKERECVEKLGLQKLITPAKTKFVYKLRD